MILLSCSNFLYAEEKNEKLMVKKSPENIQIDLKLVITNKGKDINFDYTFIVQSEGYLSFGVSSQKPDSSTDKYKNEKNVKGKRGPWFSEEISGQFMTSTEGQSLIIDSKIKFSLRFMSDNHELIPENLSIDLHSVHEESKSVKVFSGNLVDKEKRVSVFIRAKRL